MSFVIQNAGAGEKMIKDLFNGEIRSLFNNAVKKGYELASQTKENTGYLNFPQGRGKDIFPLLKNYSVEFAIIKYIQTGLLPFDFEIKFNSNKTARYFLLFDSKRKLELCVNQVSKAERIGRPAHYRKQRIESFNSFFIFPDDNHPELIVDKPIYFELNHGYQSNSPEFVVLGIPGRNNKWIDKVDISKEINRVPLTTGIKTKAEDVKEFNFEKLQEYIEESERNG